MKAIYIGRDCEFTGKIGTVWPASGYNDEESAEYDVYMFQPEGTQERDAIYVSRTEVKLLEV